MPRLGGDWANEIDPMTTCSADNTYNGLGQPTEIFSDCMNTVFGGNLRYHEATYDALARVTEGKITSDEHITQAVAETEFTRIFDTYVYGLGDIVLFRRPRDRNPPRKRLGDHSGLGDRFGDRFGFGIWTDLGTFYFFGGRVTEIRHENASSTILAA